MAEHAADHGAAYGAGAAAAALGVDLMHRLHHAAFQADFRRDVRPLRRARLVELGERTLLHGLAGADPPHQGRGAHAAEHDEGDAGYPDDRV